MNTAIQPAAGTIMKQEFGGDSLATSGETIATVLAARAKAEVEARLILAKRFPRDWDIVRAKLIKACDRPGFAGSLTEKVWGAAWYRKPIGKGVEGFSIRFAEEAMRCMGNLDARSTIIWEDESKRLVQIEVVDLECNIAIPTTVVVDKTIERSYLKEGEIAISVRTNSRDKTVYLRAATSDEVMQMQNSSISKAIRNGILRLVPGDIQKECMDRIMAIRHGDMAKDPDGFKKKVIDGFSRHGVGPGELKQYLGHDVGTSSQAELAALRDLWVELNDGKTTWHAVMSAMAEENDEQAPDEPAKGTKIEEMTKVLKRKQKEEVKVKVDYVDPKEELYALAQEMWGKKYKEALSVACKDAGFDFETIDEVQASTMLDILNEQMEGYKNEKNKTK